MHEFQERIFPTTEAKSSLWGPVKFSSVAAGEKQCFQPCVRAGLLFSQPFQMVPTAISGFRLLTSTALCLGYVSLCQSLKTLLRQ